MTPVLASPAVISDEHLMRRVQTDDGRAFEELYDRHSARAYALARVICRDVGRAEDAVQDGFSAMWRRRASYDPDRGGAQSWILALVRHRSIDIVRHSGTDDRMIEADAAFDCIPAPGSVTEEVERHDQAGRLRALLHDLPTLQREVVALAYFGGLTHTEIAERLRLPSGTVKGRMRLGLHKLRARELARHGLRE